MTTSSPDYYRLRATSSQIARDLSTNILRLQNTLLYQKETAIYSYTGTCIYFLSLAFDVGAFPTKSSRVLRKNQKRYSVRIIYFSMAVLSSDLVCLQHPAVVSWYQ
mmetsp:Transcript_5921/g.7045  ORF Transcript_5921/g.7045 Transcript_5921/m.7045 type:complete len:106 (+) Transcript_5921:682-999(+)